MKAETILKWIKENIASILIILSAIFGLIFGFILKSLWTLSPLTISYIGLPGKLLIRAFSMILVPLIITSLATGVSGTKRGENHRLVILTFVMFVSLSTFAAIFGTTVMQITKVGYREVNVNVDTHNVNSTESIIPKSDVSEEDALIDVITNAIPDNIITATFMQHYTALRPINPQNLSEGYKKVTEKIYRINMLGICIFSLILGFALVSLENDAANFKKLLEEIYAVIMKIMMGLIYLMPIGMFCWMCEESLKMKSPEILSQLIWFFVIALSCYMIHMNLFLPLLYYAFIRKNPLKYHINLIPAIIMAFGTSSSALTLPISINCVEEKNKINRSVSRFVLTLGMTIHMNGAALYYPMAIIFMGQYQGMSVTLQQSVALCFACVLMSMAFPPAPASGGQVIHFMAMAAVINVPNPFEIIPYLMTLDWLRERLSTATNIVGDCYVAPIVQKYCIKNIMKSENLWVNKQNNEENLLEINESNI